jgi:hypothetical protein
MTMSIEAMKLASWIAFAAFVGVSSWISLWHHNDEFRSSYFIALAVPLLIYAWLKAQIDKQRG